MHELLPRRGPLSTPAPSPVAELVERLRLGEREAWREFLGRYGGLIRYLGRRLRLDSDEVDDLLQATSLQVLRKLDGLRDPERFGPWLHAVATNEGRRILRTRRPRGPEPGADGDEPTSIEGVAEGPDPQELLEAALDVEALEAALARTDDRCRRLLRALYFRDPRPDYREISTEFGIAVGSIGPIRQRCLERLAANFDDVSRPPPSTSSPAEDGPRRRGTRS